MCPVRHPKAGKGANSLAEEGQRRPRQGRSPRGDWKSATRHTRNMATQHGAVGEAWRQPSQNRGPPAP